MHFHLAVLLLSAAPLARALLLHNGRGRASDDDTYFWPSARGQVGLYSTSPYAGPTNLSSSLAWSWHHPMHKYATVTLGVLLDGQKNVYLAADDAIRKFSPVGALLWEFKPPAGGGISMVPTLMDGAVFGSSMGGFAFAINMENGTTRWLRQVAKNIGGDTGFVGAHDGIVLLCSDLIGDCCGKYPYGPLGNSRIRALHAATGDQLWEFAPDEGVWNFWPNFHKGERIVAFQDHTGRVYALGLDDGHLLWKKGGKPGTFTDGSTLLGPNDVLYAVGLLSAMGEDTPGTVTAYRLMDGHQLWQTVVPRPPNIFPGVGRLGPGEELSVVQPVGLQCGPTQHDVYAFDAETGEQRWFWKGPKNPNPWCKGDFEGLFVRKTLNIRGMCMPNPWSAPTIDAAGRVFTGDQDGKIYALKDANSDGFIEPEEVSSYNCESAFSSPGSAHAPGMMAIASCDSLYVFKS